MALAFNLLLGLIFGAGLIVSGMANPEKVLNFLDLTGAWDPSLAFVMAGAIAVTATGYGLIQRTRSAPILEIAFEAPPSAAITGRLIIGAGLFGIGWGLSGLCPGPALTSLAIAAPGTLAFLPTLIAGIVAGTLVNRHLDRRENG